MSLVPCLCTNCGASLEIDDKLEAAVCKFCGTPFIVEKAINNYKIVNITMDAKNPKALIHKGLRILDEIYYNEDAVKKIADELSDISEEDFYPEFFYFASFCKDNGKWLLENSKEEEKKMLASFLFRAITRDYNKESFDEVKLNIRKNYEGVNFENICNDKTHNYVMMLGKLEPYFDSEMEGKWNSLKVMAKEELTEMASGLNDMTTAVSLYGYAKSFTPIVDEALFTEIQDKVKAYAKNASVSNFKEIYALAEMTGDKSLFHYIVSNDLSFTFDHIHVKEREYPSGYALKYCNGDGFLYLLLQLDSSRATVVRLDHAAFDYSYLQLMPNISREDMSYFESLIKYRTRRIDGCSLDLVYEEGISYKKSTLDKILGGIGKGLKFFE